MRINPILCTFFLLLQSDALPAQDTGTVDEPVEETKNCGFGDSIGAASGNNYMHRGKFVDELDAIDVIAKLKSFTTDIVYVHMQDHTYSYRVSVFEVVQPEEYRGEKITVHVRPSGALDSAWTEVGRAYDMSIPSEFFPELDGFVTPDMITILKERKNDGG